MALSIKGFAFSGKLEDLNDTAFERLEERFATVIPLGPSRAAIDVVSSGYYRVSENVVAGIGSDDKSITTVSHGAKKGDVIRLKTTANTIDESEVTVKSVTANVITLEGVLSTTITSGDTYDILRPVAPRYDSSGAIVTSATSDGLIKFTLDGSTQTVTEDTGTPANNAPLPVKLVSATGDINITAGDLNVQLSHVGASFDSVRVGDGTETMAINASNEAQVADDTARTTLSAISGKLPASLGQLTMANSLSVAIASNQSAVPISAASLPLPTGAATEASLASLAAEDFATETTLSAMSAKLPAALGQLAMAASMSVTIASNQSAVAVSAASLPLPTGAATEATLSSLAGKDFATQTTLATLGTEATLSAMSAKLPASLGAKTSANSFSVTFASDAVTPAAAGRTAVDKARLSYSSTNVTSGAWVELKASIAGNWNYMEIFDSSGQALIFGTGAAASETERFYIFPGGNGIVEFAGSSATRVALKAVTDTASAGEILVNFYS